MMETADPGREVLIEEIAASMRSLVRQLRGAFARSAEELDLRVGDAEALWVLSVRGSTAVTDLARALDIDPANASALVSRLERRGLVERGTADRDRRRRLVSLTEGGDEARRRLADSVGEQEATFAGLSTAELGALHELLGRIGGVRQTRGH